MMLKKTILIQSFLLLISSNIFSQELTKNVDPFVGTSGHGHTFPGATLPFGMVQLSPDTGIEGWDWCSGYHASDNSIIGFSHTHVSGTGGADLGDILLMPTIGKLQFISGSKENPDVGYRSRFTHANEEASPGYYSVLLDDYNILAELTTTERVGFHKYTFPKSDDANIILDLEHGIRDRTTEASIIFSGNNRIEGFRRSTGWAIDQYVFFVMEFSKPFKTLGTVNDENITNIGKSTKGINIKGYVSFNTDEKEEVLVKVGISSVSIEGAKANLLAEIPGWDFELVRSQADKTWEKELSKIMVEGGTKDQRTIFYTSLYHTMIHPNISSDVDGKYRGMDKKIHQAGDSGYYTLFSLWDTYRALHPLLTIIDPERDGMLVNSLIEKYNERGLLPKWELASNETGTMIGYHAVPVIVDAYMKGIRNYDIEKAFEAIKHSADMDHLGLESYKRLGYVAAAGEGRGVVSKTLEFAYDDWCIAVMAEALGKEEDFKRFSKRASNYKNVFNSSNGFMQPRTENGNLVPFFNSYETTKDYVEANAWQYSFYVPHDVKGLISLHGGRKNLGDMIDRLFTDETRLEETMQDITGLIGQYAHGNEPSHHMAYLYNYTGQPWKTQKMVHQILNKMYSVKRDGISGNEDCGQMSAWYVLSAMGFYSFSPGNNEYLIGSPIFDKVTINNNNGKKFVISAKNVSESNLYIQSASLNGKPYTKNHFVHSDITEGSELVFEMGENPNKEWGIDATELPYSLSVNDFASPPYQKEDISMFIDSAQVDLNSTIEGTSIYYTLDGTEPNQESELFTVPFTIKETKTIKAISYKVNMEPSNILKFQPEKLVYRESEQPKNITNGVAYSYYEGIFFSAFDLVKLDPLKSGVIDYFSFSPAKIENHYGFIYKCFIEVPRDGIYNFYSYSDDGSILFIGEKVVASNDGKHGLLKSFGTIGLKKGLHSMKILYFEDKSGQELNVYYEGPGIEKQLIPKNILYVKKNK